MGVVGFGSVAFFVKKWSICFWPIFPIENLEADFSNKISEKNLNEKREMWLKRQQNIKKLTQIYELQRQRKLICYVFIVKEYL